MKRLFLNNALFQQELAKQICVAENTVTSWTTGNREPTIRNYLWICRFVALLEEKDYEVIVLETAEYF